MVEIQFGALCDPIAKQLKQQGYTISMADNLRLQKIADAIIRLKLHDILTDGAARICHQKLMKQIVQTISISQDGRS